jgi:hypothetical protein
MVPCDRLAHRIDLSSHLRHPRHRHIVLCYPISNSRCTPHARNCFIEMPMLRRLPGPLIPLINPRATRAIPAFPSPRRPGNSDGIHLRLQPASFHLTFQRQFQVNITPAMASSEANLRAFFQAQRYAVVGASTNTEKYGYKGEFCVSSLASSSRAGRRTVSVGRAGRAGQPTWFTYAL